MNEHTKLELLKIAATLTTAVTATPSVDASKNPLTEQPKGKGQNHVKSDFEFFCSYLFENFNHLDDKVDTHNES